MSSSLSRSRSRSRSGSSERDGHRLHIADIGKQPHLYPTSIVKYLNILGDDVRKSDLERVFAPYGELKEIWLTNSTPCFGFAVYKDKKDAAIAVKACDGV